MTQTALISRLRKVEEALRKISYGPVFVGSPPTQSAAEWQRIIAEAALADIRELIKEADGQGWQPIETAPKDEEVFIGRFIDGQFKFGKSMQFYYTGNEMEGEYFHGYVWSIDDVSESIAEFPTHWMPLPPPPALGEPK